MRLWQEGELSSNENNTLTSSVTLVQGELATIYHFAVEGLENSINRQVFFRIKSALNATDNLAEQKATIHGLPGWATLFPIIILLLVSLFSGQALVALFVGIFLGSMFVNGFNPLTGFMRMIDYYIIHALGDLDHAKVIMFTFYLSGMVALLQKSGGAGALAQLLGKLATTRLRALWSVYLAGWLIFLDDLASCLIVGGNLYTVTDQYMISREKVAWLVHLTSAPLTSLAPVSSWIGFQLGLLGTQLKATEVDQQPFIFFLNTLPSRYFPLLALALAFVLLVFNRDFGSILRAERRAINLKQLVPPEDVQGSGNEEIDFLEPDEETPKRWYNAGIPILITVAITIISLMLTGYYVLVEKAESDPTVEFTAATIAGSGDSYNALLYGSFVGCLVAMAMYRLQGIMTFNFIMDVFMYGLKDMVSTMLILVCAWGIGLVFVDLKVPVFLSSVLKKSIPPGLVPFLTYVLSCVISFVTGTSWGTMTILLPLVMPLAKSIDPNMETNIYTLSAAAVFSGAIFGDLCSPLAATTILTTLSLKISVKTHVNSQLAYGIVCIFIGGLVGHLPVGFGVYADWVGLLIGIGVIVVFVFIFAVPTESNQMGRLDWLLMKFGFNITKDLDKEVEVKDV